MTKSFDYIIVGAGASGLLLAHKMANDPFFDDKSILLIDKEKKNLNDRTWCFWESNEGMFDAVLTKKWQQIIFKSDSIHLQTSILPHQYKMLRSKNFYKKMWDSLQGKSNFTIVIDKILQIEQQQDFAIIKAEQQTFTSTTVFSSVFTHHNFTNQTNFPVLYQHFLGYFIKTKQPIFDADAATFMDFSIPQKGNTRFMYVLPYTTNEALFEYTLFSKDLLSKEEYEQEINKYLVAKGITDFEITETEQGAIPMTCYPFWKNNSKNIFFMGTAGGWSKPSTGFTFQNTHKQTSKLIAFLKTKKPLQTFYKSNRFWFYDLLLLDILAANNQLGASIFSAMFAKVAPQKILKFLDEKTTFFEEVRIFSKMPKRLFIKALLKRIF